MPVRGGDQERMSNQQTFDKIEEYELSDEIAPGQPFCDRKKAELKIMFTAEPVTMVTTVQQADFAAVQVPQVDSSGFLKVTSKEYAVPWPRDAGKLKFRLVTLGVCWNYLKYQAPENPALRLIDLQSFERYTECLFGAKVWGLATKALEGKVLSTPDIAMV